MRFTKSYVILVFGFMILSCSEWDLERVEFTQVITIGVIEVGSNSAFLIGDIENIRESGIVESGFVLSSASSDDGSLRLDQSSVIPVISQGLDTISDDRAFAARATDLNGSTQYFFRAYVKIEGEDQVAYGNIDQFITSELNVSIESVNRTSEGCPTTVMVNVQVNGLAPGGSTQIGIVYTDDLNNVLPTVENGILMKGMNPSATGVFSIELGVACERSYFMQVVLNPESANPLYSNPHAFTMIEGGLWKEKSLYPGSVKSGKPVSFAYKSTGYMGGGGGLGISQNSSRLWSYEVETDLWTSGSVIENMDISESVSIVFNDKVYISSGLAPIGHCGKSGTIDFLNNGIDIDGKAHTWESLCGSCNAEICVVCGEYFVPGPGFDIQRFDCLCYNGGTILYDPIENTSVYSDEPLFGRKSNALVLKIQNNAYVLGGEALDEQTERFDSSGGTGDCGPSLRACSSTMIQFNVEAILAMDNLSGGGRINLTGFSIGTLGYAGLGMECTQNFIEGETGMNMNRPIVGLEELIRINSFFSFNPGSPPGSQWQEVASYPGTGDNIMTFSSDKLGYVVFKKSDESRILWQFDPDADADGEWSEIGEIPNPTNNNPYHLFTIGNVSYVYFPASRNNFWMYIPEVI